MKQVDRLTADPAGDVIAPRVQYLEEWIRDCQRSNRIVDADNQRLRARVRDLETLLDTKNEQLRRWTDGNA